MELLKKHYEKIILGVVLLVLVVTAAFLPVIISKETDELRAMADAEFSRTPKELPPLELGPREALLARVQTPLVLDFSANHKVFNPVPWKKRATDNIPIKAQKGNVGVEAVVVTKITPLHLIITLDSVAPSDSGVRYTIGVEREAAATAALRRKRAFLGAPNVKSDGGFTIVDVRGAPDNPELVLELADTGERAVITREQPFRRVDGYMADLRYPPDNRSWLNQRVSAGGAGMAAVGAGGGGTPAITIEGESYIVVAINKDEVVLSARSNNKKTSLLINPADRP